MIINSIYEYENHIFAEYFKIMGSRIPPKNYKKKPSAVHGLRAFNVLFEHSLKFGLSKL